MPPASASSVPSAGVVPSSVSRSRERRRMAASSEAKATSASGPPSVAPLPGRWSEVEPARARA
eukprot:1639874-Lingulodinium_polyedra.AAC.1